MDRTIDEHLPYLRRLFNNQERIMAVPLHVLILEDSALDAELMLDHLSPGQWCGFELDQEPVKGAHDAAWPREHHPTQ